MIDLKPYFDAVNTTEAEVQRVANEMDTLFRQDTDEAKAQALAMQATLEEALAKHDKAVSIYESMQKANRPNEVAKNYVPVAASTEPVEGAQPTVIKRQDYDRLSQEERALFIRSHGIVKD